MTTVIIVSSYFFFGTYHQSVFILYIRFFYVYPINFLKSQSPSLPPQSITNHRYRHPCAWYAWLSQALIYQSTISWPRLCSPQTHAIMIGWKCRDFFDNPMYDWFARLGSICSSMNIFDDDQGWWHVWDNSHQITSFYPDGYELWGSDCRTDGISSWFGWYHHDSSPLSDAITI